MLIKSLAQQDVSKQYTPPNWAVPGYKTLYAITFPADQSSQMVTTKQNAFIPQVGLIPFQDTTLKTNASGPGFNVSTQTSMFVFDAIKRAQHRLTSNVTQHPIQSGYNITDHIIRQGSQLVLEVGMSDAIASYNVPGYSPMWDMNPSKSVSAFQVMEMLMIQRKIMTVNTRLETYRNMVLINIESEESHKTYFGGLAMNLTFQEIFVADVSTQVMSQRIQTTGDTKQGTARVDQPTQATIDQHQVTAPTKVPGAGFFQSPAIIAGIQTIQGIL